jgi:RNA polymerase sigma factor (sigma-70 family)
VGRHLPLQSRRLNQDRVAVWRGTRRGSLSFSSPLTGRPCLFDGAELLLEPYIGQMLFKRSEADLIRAAMGGDGSAFAELLRPEYSAAFRVAYGLLHNVDEAEDAVQEAAFTAWKKLGNVREGSPLRPWFLAIVANHCRTVTKGRWWSVTLTARSEGEAPAADLAAGIDLRRALARLGHDERLVLVLRYYLDMPYEEIAGLLGISPKAARTRVERALHRVRPILQVREALI